MASKSLIFLCLILIVFYSDASTIKTNQRQRRSTNVCATVESWNRSTNNDPGKRCIFPFEYKGVTYNACTDVDSEKVSRTKFFWCATEVNRNGRIHEHSRNWGECNLHCTTEPMCECDSRGTQTCRTGDDWCWLKEKPCKLLNGTVVDLTWSRCVSNNRRQVNCPWAYFKNEETISYLNYESGIAHQLIC